MRKTAYWPSIACLLLVMPAFAAKDNQPIPLESFIKHPKFQSVKISPTGEYLAASVMATEDTGALLVLKRVDLKPTGHFKLAGKSFVDDFHWASKERIVLTVAKKDGALSKPVSTGEIYATNWDGTKQELLIGPNPQAGNAIKSRKQRIEAAALIDTLVDDEKNILVSVYPLGNEEGTYPKIERLNIYTGSRSILARAPVLNAQYATDNASQVRFAMGAGVDNRTKLFYRASNDGEWKLIHDEKEDGLATTAVGFSADGAKAYLRVEESAGPDGIYEWDPKTGAKRLVAKDDAVDPLRLVYDHRGVAPLGVIFMDGRPRLQVLDEDAAEVRILKSLEGSFPGQWVKLENATEDGKFFVFSVASDKNPGDYYLFDADTKKATYLLSRREWISPKQMAEMKPIEYVARDGMKIRGYLTVPADGNGKKLPMILNPHGGPIGPYDAWGFNPEVQLFASRGYAVLQLNYRGSGNYGKSFLKAGYRQWGDKMIDDMTDALKWAVDQGIADPERVCIYGASYGGYAAGQAIIREPDLYRCAVGYVGVYDMPMMYTHGDIPDRDSGINYLKEILGTGKDFLKRISPSKNADKIKTPIFIVVGNEDVRAHPAHSRAFRDALKKAGKAHEWLEKDYEGHGFFKEENNKELYTKMLAWFDRYIGGK